MASRAGRPVAKGCAPWDEKVRDLASRGVTVRALLAFYRRLGTPESMSHFDAAAHTTADVVRQAIIPQSRGQEHSSGALAVALMSGRETVPQHMVTHSWSNRFSHLVAAVVAHALGAPSFEQVLPRLGDEELGALESELFWKGTLDEAYWICAFAVDQHAAICGDISVSTRGGLDITAGSGHSGEKSKPNLHPAYPSYIALGSDPRTPTSVNSDRNWRPPSRFLSWPRLATSSPAWLPCSFSAHGLSKPRTAISQLWSSP